MNLLKRLCEPEIRDFWYAIFDKNVGGLEVTMNDALSGKLLQAINNMFESLDCLILLHHSMLS
jgi:hypothetical protein